MLVSQPATIRRWSDMMPFPAVCGGHSGDAWCMPGCLAQSDWPAWLRLIHHRVLSSSATSATALPAARGKKSCGIKDASSCPHFFRPQSMQSSTNVTSTSAIVSPGRVRLAQDTALIRSQRACASGSVTSPVSKAPRQQHADYLTQHESFNCTCNECILHSRAQHSTSSTHDCPYTEHSNTVFCNTLHVHTSRQPTRRPTGNRNSGTLVSWKASGGRSAGSCTNACSCILPRPLHDIQVSRLCQMPTLTLPPAKTQRRRHGAKKKRGGYRAIRVNIQCTKYEYKYLHRLRKDRKHANTPMRKANAARRLCLCPGRCSTQPNRREAWKRRFPDKLRMTRTSCRGG
ncbi:hypothetical protein V8C42DRAFT_101823 [Trichoderma barbatum]